MKALIILATLLATSAFAGEKPFMEFGDIKGESVIDNAEESANEVKDEAAVEIPVCDAKDRRCVRITNTGEETASNARELDKSSTRVQDYNSSRSNRRGIRLDEDSDDDGLGVDDVARACNAKDNDCDDDVRDAASGLPTGKRQHKPIE